MMAVFSVPRLTILSVAVAIVVGASSGRADATQLAASPSDIPAGRWVGLVIAAADANCRFKDSRPIVAKTADGHVTFLWGPSNNQTVLKGDIGADGGVNVSAPMAGRDNEFTITGKFVGGTFAGEFAVSKTKCFGKVAVNAAERVTASVATKRDARKAPEAGSAAAEEARFWQEIQHSTNLSDFVTYLQKYPNGIFVPLAESQMRALIARQGAPAVPGPQDALAGIDFGRYHALVIGINNYAHLPKLKTAVNDAKAVAALLEKDYGFKVRLLIDPSRTEMIDVFDDYLKTLTAKDNLLIYYAGHGWLDRATDRGYWLPVDAQEGRRSNWVSNATITDTLKSLAAKHVIVIADSCFSGTLTRAATVGLRDKNYLKRMVEKQARVAMVSGGLEPVADDAGSGNSPFAKAFMTALKANQGVIDGIQLFGDIRRPIMLDAKQTPEYSDVRNAGHDGGDFLFVRKK